MPSNTAMSVHSAQVHVEHSDIFVVLAMPLNLSQHDSSTDNFVACSKIQYVLFNILL